MTSGLAHELASGRMHGAGNSFVIVDERTPHGVAHAELARRLCAAGTEDALDGVLVLERGVGSPWRMRVFNADGGEAEMCGNGIRCVVRYLFDGGEVERTCVIETLAGPVACEITSIEPVFEVRADLGDVRFPDELRAQELNGLPRVSFVRVDVGNPHAVVLCDDVATVDLPALARRFAGDPRFAQGTNVHAVEVAGSNGLRVRHFERGVGETAACGTGAVASAAVALARGLAVSPVDVFVPGGRLRVDWQPGGRAFLTGPAEWEPSALVPS